MKKLVKEDLNEKFEKNSDPIHDMNIGLNAIDYSDDLKIVDALYEKRKPGYYLANEKGVFILYTKELDDVEKYVESKIGEKWNLENAYKWRGYEITEVFSKSEGGGEDYFTF